MPDKNKNTKCPYCGRRKRPAMIRCEKCQRIHQQVDLAQTDARAVKLEKKRMALELEIIRKRNAAEMLDNNSPAV